MTLLNFKKAVYAMMGRSIGTDTSDGTFVVNGVDLCLLAINQARLAAQRDHDFTALEGVYGAQISKYGKSYDEFVTVPEGETAVSMRTVRGVHKYALSGSSVELLERYDMQHVSELDRVGGRDLASDRIFCYSFGRKLFLWNSGPTWVAVRGIALLSDLTSADNNGTDFFLTHGYDWLLWKSCQILNGFVKEDSRINISTSLLAQAWESLVKVDQNFDADWTSLD
jgi:hypothetical protein